MKFYALPGRRKVGAFSRSDVGVASEASEELDESLLQGAALRGDSCELDMDSAQETVALLRKTVRGALAKLGGQTGGAILQAVTAVVLARLLVASDFGLVAMVSSFSLLAMNFGLNGFTEYIVQREVLDLREVSSIFWLHLVIAGVLAVVFVTGTPAIVWFYGEPRLKAVTSVLAMGIILQAASTHHLALLKREMRFSRIAAWQVGSFAVASGVAIVLASVGLGYWALVVRQILAVAIMTAFAWLACPWRPEWPPLLGKGLPALRYAMAVYGGFSLSYLSRSIDKVLLGYFQGADTLGHYERAYQLFALPAGQVLAPLHEVSLASLSRFGRKRVEFRRYYLRALSLVSGVAGGAGLVLFLGANDLVLVLLGNSWSETGRIAAAFAPGIAAMLAYETNSWLHLSLGAPTRWLRWATISLAVTGIVFFASAHFGAIWVAIAYSGLQYVLCLPALWFAGRPAEIRVIELIRAIGPPVISAGVVAALWMMLESGGPMGILGFESFPVLVRLAAMSFSCLTCYLVLLILFPYSYQPVQEAFHVLRRTFPGLVTRSTAQGEVGK